VRPEMQANVSLRRTASEQLASKVTNEIAEENREVPREVARQAIDLAEMYDESAEDLLWRMLVEDISLTRSESEQLASKVTNDKEAKIADKNHEVPWRIARQAIDLSQNCDESAEDLLWKMLVEDTSLVTWAWRGNWVGLLYDERMMYHMDLEDPDHDERPARISTIHHCLQQQGIVKRCVPIPCREASREELLSKHDKAHVDTMLALKQLSDEQAILESRNYNSVYLCPSSTQAALLACGSVVEASQRVCNGNVSSALCVVRPPGHHAEYERAMGFSLFNNVAIAAAEMCNSSSASCVLAQRVLAQRVLIVDWDIHHGNGTQRMFESDSQILFCSIHRYDRDRHDEGGFYPGGRYGDYDSVGTAEGEGYSINIPWDVEGEDMDFENAPGDAEYAHAFSEVIMPIARDFNPDLVLVSAGFDAGIGDPMGECNVSPRGYYDMTAQLMTLAGGKVVVALEGGYNLRTISYSMAACAAALLGDSPPPAPLEDDDIYIGIIGMRHAETVHNVRQHLSSWWPCLAED